MEVLAALAKGDPNRNKPVCHILDSFTVKGPHGVHRCMAFDVQGNNLLSLIRAYNYKGLPVAMVKLLAVQMLDGLA